MNVDKSFSNFFFKFRPLAGPSLCLCSFAHVRNVSSDLMATNCSPIAADKRPTVSEDLSLDEHLISGDLKSRSNPITARAERHPLLRLFRKLAERAKLGACLKSAFQVSGRPRSRVQATVKLSHQFSGPSSGKEIIILFLALSIFIR